MDGEARVPFFFISGSEFVEMFVGVGAAVFLPLNLVVGAFGMNFTYLPLVQARWGPLLVGAFMALLVGGLVIWLRRRRWI